MEKADDVVCVAPWWNNFPVRTAFDGGEPMRPYTQECRLLDGLSLSPYREEASSYTGQTDELLHWKRRQFDNLTVASLHHLELAVLERDGRADDQRFR